MNGALHTLAAAPRTLVLEDGSAAGSGWTAWGLRVPTWGEVPTWAWWMIGVAAGGLVVIACVRMVRRMLLEWRCGDDASARMWLLMCDRLGVGRAERRALAEIPRGTVPHAREPVHEGEIEFELSNLLRVGAPNGPR